VDLFPVNAVEARVRLLQAYDEVVTIRQTFPSVKQPPRPYERDTSSAGQSSTSDSEQKSEIYETGWPPCDGSAGITFCADMLPNPDHEAVRPTSLRGSSALAGPTQRARTTSFFVHVWTWRQCGQLNLLLLIFAAAHKLSSIV